MRIEYADATGSPSGQFIVYAESKQDQAILAQFLRAQESQNWQLRIHGNSWHCASPHGPMSFNFGFGKRPPLWTRLRLALRRGDK